MKGAAGRRHSRTLTRLLRWEYWPFPLVYGVLLPYWLLLCLRNRSLFFFNASNPAIENGGLLNESKKDIHAILPDDLYPATLHFPAGSEPGSVRRNVEASGLAYPVMGKPDIGCKGQGVRRITDPEGLEDYARSALMDFHIQECIHHEKEAGVFYHRYPGESKGRVTGIVRKEFLSVTGDGVRNVRELLEEDSRGVMYVGQVSLSLGDGVSEIPAKGERIVVSPFGNHARGALFIDDSHLIDERLHRRMDEIADRIPGFFFGRLDIRFRSWEDFLEGREFKMLEVNGAGAEPTHIYDPRHGILFAWWEICRHWRIMARVSRMNHRRGVPYLGFRAGMEVFRKYGEIASDWERMPV
jgi:hypothetical protein